MFFSSCTNNTSNDLLKFHIPSQSDNNTTMTTSMPVLMEIKKMFEHINDILCSCIFSISMEIIFKSANLYFVRYEVAVLILKSSHIVIKLVLARYKFALLIKDLI